MKYLTKKRLRNLLGDWEEYDALKEIWEHATGKRINDFTSPELYIRSLVGQYYDIHSYGKNWKYPKDAAAWASKKMLAIRQRWVWIPVPIKW